MGVSLAEALSISSEARVITSGTAPHVIIHTNRAWSELTGYKFTEAVGKTCKFLQGPCTQQAALNALNSAIKANRFIKTKLINYARDGTPFESTIECGPVTGGSHFYATVSGTPIRDGSVPPLRLPADALLPPESESLEPVCYADRAAKRPKRSTDRMRLLDVLANHDDPIVLCCKDYPHVITHPNQPWLEMCGYTLEEVEGHTNKILTGPETDPDALEQLNACVARCETSVQTVVNYKKGGEKFLNQVTTAPVYDENDELAAFMSMLREIDADL